MRELKNVLEEIAEVGEEPVEEKPINKIPTYHDIPNELKMQIINMLGSNGRSNMSRVSRLSAALCKQSPFYLQDLTFRRSRSRSNAFILVGHEMNRTDYELVFANNEIICWKPYEPTVLWREKLKDANTKRNSCNYFGKMLEEYQKSIRALDINPDGARHLEFNVVSFPRLESLKITTQIGIDYSEIFEKLQKPLKVLQINKGFTSREYDYYLLENQQIYQIKDKITFNGLHLKNEHLIKLSAKYVKMKIGGLTEENIADWLKTYQNGTMQHTVIHYSFRLKDEDFDSNFDCHKLWRLLGSDEQDIEKNLAIRNKTNKRKFMYLNFSRGILKLRNPTA